METTLQASGVLENSPSLSIHCEGFESRLEGRGDGMDRHLGLDQESANFFCKGQRGNILGSVGHMASVATTPFCCCGKAATDDM